MAGGLTASQIKGLARQAEIESGTGATGFTLLRFAARSPVEKLINAKEIGQDEIRAALEISRAYHAITGPVSLRSQRWERVDYGRGGFEPAALVAAQERYKEFAKHWLGSMLLRVIIETVILERAFSTIDCVLSVRHGTAKKLTIRGLRDYARRSGWVRGAKDEEWKRTRALCS